MKKRDFIRASALGATGIILSPLAACEGGKKAEDKAGDLAAADSTAAMQTSESTTSFELPELPYDYNALAPAIDEQTMKLHHDKHHAGYVRKLNAALEQKPLQGNLEEILAQIEDLPEFDGVRNNGGGHYNHSLYWKIMKAKPDMKKPEGELLKHMTDAFGSFEKCAMGFKKEAGTVFGSGWAWLCVSKDKELFVTSTPNQDNPLMANVVEKTGTPILGIDVWEHAYYLNYKNKRGDYIDAWTGILNWEQIMENYKAAMA